MLHSYEAVYDHGQLRWLTDKPPVGEARVIVTLLLPKDISTPQPYLRKPSARIAGKARILGDIVAPAAPAGDWKVFK